MHDLIGSLGVMQGRLLPKFQDRYQAHPVGYWQKEFNIASEMGLDYIEFILDFNDVDLNPLLSQTGIAEIMDVVQRSGVGIRSVCADYFMEAPLHVSNSASANQSKVVLKKLLENGKELGLTDIVIPCVDQSSLQDQDSQDKLVEALSPFLELAEKTDINLALETDLSPITFLNLLKRFDSSKITVNYDTGNSASLGFDPIEEFAAYGDRISDIHIKDRKLHGSSVILGTGDTDFNSFFKALNAITFKGPFIMQVYRDEEGVSVFKEQLEWFKTILT
jgi:sugar phosphate isomerase/epimerase